MIMKALFSSNSRQRPRAAGIIHTCFVFVILLGLSLPAVAWAQELLAPERIILTWTADPQTTQTITWLGPPLPGAWVQYLEAADYGGSFAPARQLEVAGTPFSEGGTVYRYTATLTDLAPGTGYFYRVGSEGAWSKPATFATAAKAENFTFLYMGDIQAGYEDWGRTLERLYEENPRLRFALLGGDLTDRGYDEGEWEEFLAAASTVFSRIPVLPTLGNHDGAIYLKFFALPENGPAGLKQEFYSFDYGDAHFVALYSGNNTGAAVKEWLREDLKSSDKKWKFAFFHHPAYPAVEDHKGIDSSIRENWVPILEEGGVEMVFVGHQHLYMRTHPIFQGEIQAAGGGITYVMGNAGSKFYDGGGGLPYIAWEKTGSNYQLIELSGDLLTLTSKEAGGELIEIYTLQKNSGPGKPLYKIVPLTDPVYTAGETKDGLTAMTVNESQTGLRYFTVSVVPLTTPAERATVLFTQQRDGMQVGLSAVAAGPLPAETAQAGFQVAGGDTVKAYIVDNLTNAVDSNPVVLQ